VLVLVSMLVVGADSGASDSRLTQCKCASLSTQARRYDQWRNIAVTLGPSHTLGVILT
jgi:hypothetical protein